MNLARALRLRTDDVLVAVACGRALVVSADYGERAIPYCDGDRARVVRVENDSPEAVRLSDGQPLGRVNLRNWEPVTRCDVCVGEYGEVELKECETCGVRQCAGCVENHICSGTGLHNGRRPPRQGTLTCKRQRS